MIREKNWSKKLHRTTKKKKKVLLGLIVTLTMVAAGLDVYQMLMIEMKIELADLFLLFIYAEIIGMVGAFYASNRIPVTLPIIIAITALCRLIVLHSKEADPLVLVAEAGAILVLAGAAYMMSLKDKLSIEKDKIRNQQKEEDK